MNEYHDKAGRFTNLRLKIAHSIDTVLRKSRMPVLMILALIVLWSWGAGAVKNNKVLTYIAPPTAEAAISPSLSVEELEAKLDAIVWGIESDRKVMAEGEIFPTFDPSSSMYAQCIKIGGKQNKDCISYGPHQEKIGTIEVYWPKLHNGEKISDREARECAESNECSRRFFYDCSENIKGCAENWTSFENHKTEGQIYLDLIRQAKGISL